MKILALEPFYSGSHRTWLDGLSKNSSHEIRILGLEPICGWKWNLRAGAIKLAKDARKLDFVPDLLLGSSMLDLASFKAISGNLFANIPSIVYMHETQFDYPWSEKDKDRKANRMHYGFTNYLTALVADKVIFNSKFHLESFFKSLNDLFQDKVELCLPETLTDIRGKSLVIEPGVDLKSLDLVEKPKKTGSKIILWNHRWEYDKDPETFFSILKRLKEENVDFKLVVLGQSPEARPQVFDRLESEFSDRILHFGEVSSRKEYAYWLHQSDFLPVTSKHDFFGISVVEAIYCSVVPLLPNRLNYPSLIPKNLHANFLYQGTEDFFQKLSLGLTSSTSNLPASLSETMLKFDWNTIISLYDDLFAQMGG